MIEESKEETTSILDSSHIVTTESNTNHELSSLILYNIKIVTCGDYIQVYFYKDKGAIQNELYLRKKISKNENIDDNVKTTALALLPEEPSKEIQIRSIIRSKLECQRLAKSNMKDWKTFITLTFKDNITDLEFANKKLRNYIDSVKRKKKDFKYLCIPEFQERGAVHYHLLTNIDINSELIPKRDLLKLYNNTTNTWKEIEYYDLKYWNLGFSSAEPLVGDAKKVVGYISKYMTKNIDNRLFNRHRYFYSRNLIKPTAKYLNLENDKELEIFKKIIRRTDLIYHNGYINPYDNSEVLFDEYLKKVSDSEYELRELTFLN